MNAVKLILAFLVLMLLFGIMNLTINYIMRRDGNGQVSLRKKLWLIPTLSTFIIVPVLIFSVLFDLLFHTTASYTQIISYENVSSLLSFALVVLVLFLLFESLVHPLSIGLLRLWLGRDASIYTKQCITMITDTCLLYLISIVIPGIHVNGLLQALSIAAFYHLIEWFLMGVQTFIHHRKQIRSST